MTPVFTVAHLARVVQFTRRDNRVAMARAVLDRLARAKNAAEVRAIVRRLLDAHRWSARAIADFERRGDAYKVVYKTPEKPFMAWIAPPNFPYRLEPPGPVFWLRGMKELACGLIEVLRERKADGHSGS